MWALRFCTAGSRGRTARKLWTTRQKSGGAARGCVTRGIGVVLRCLVLTRVMWGHLLPQTEWGAVRQDAGTGQQFDDGLCRGMVSPPCPHRIAAPTRFLSHNCLALPLPRALVAVNTSMATVERVRLLATNIFNLLSQLRPVQAYEQIEARMRLQLEERRKLIAELNAYAVTWPVYLAVLCWVLGVV